MSIYIGAAATLIAVGLHSAVLTMLNRKRGDRQQDRRRFWDGRPGCLRRAADEVSDQVPIHEVNRKSAVGVVENAVSPCAIDSEKWKG